MVSPRVVALTALLVPSLVTAAHADSGALMDHFGPREVAVGETGRADAVGATSIALNPSGLALNRELAFEVAYGHDNTDSAHAITVSACDSTVPVPGCFYYRYFGSDPEVGGAGFHRRVHEAGLTAARSLGDVVYLGTTTRWFDYDSELDDEESSSGFGLDTGLTLAPASFVRLGVAGYNLISQDSPHYPRGVGAGLSVRPLPALSLAADGLWDLDLADGEDAGRYSLGAEYFLVGEGGQAGYAFRVGGLRDNTNRDTYVTGGLGFRSIKVGVDVAVRKQTQGDDLLVLASIRLFAPGAAQTQSAPSGF